MCHLRVFVTYQKEFETRFAVGHIYTYICILILVGAVNIYFPTDVNSGVRKFTNLIPPGYP